MHKIPQQSWRQRFLYLCGGVLYNIQKGESIMKLGRAFELFVKNVLISVGFSEVKSDGLYVFDGAAGQMLQGLGEAHNADVLLEPPVQTPFYSRSRLLIECKDYKTKKIGLDTVRSALGLREDINNFNIVDSGKLKARRAQRRPSFLPTYERYSYQVAMASLDGYSPQAQEFAATYRIPLLQFDRLPFWNEFCEMLGYGDHLNGRHGTRERHAPIDVTEEQIIDLARRIGQRMALAITSSGQILFLYHEQGENIEFADDYTLHWGTPSAPWRLRSGEQSYSFQLPDDIMKQWLENATDELNMKKVAIDCKANFMSNMVVYYSQNGSPVIRMISINKYALEEARTALRQ